MPNSLSEDDYGGNVHVNLSMSLNVQEVICHDYKKGLIALTAARSNNTCLNFYSLLALLSS